MPKPSNAGAALLLAVATLFAQDPPVWGQAALDSGPKILTLYDDSYLKGLYDRDNNPTSYAYGGEFGRMVPGPVPGGYVFVPEGKVLESPTVAPDSVGFYNSTGASVAFSVTIDGIQTPHDLVAHEIETLRLSDGSRATATVSTGSSDETVDLAPGTIYLLKGENDRWVFAQF